MAIGRHEQATALDSVHINSDMVFGLFKILGYNFSPRFRDLDDQRFWRASMPGVETGTYGVLEDLARNRVNRDRVLQKAIRTPSRAGRRTAPVRRSQARGS